MSKTDKFIEKAKTIHGDKYDYSGTVYEHSTRPVQIGCTIHGLFFVTPNNHLSSKQGCQKCSNRYRPTLDEFKEQARAVHGDQYDYSMVIYVNNKTHVTIVCPTHGTFSQTPKDHIHSNSGCPQCGNIHKGSYHKKNTEWFIQQGHVIHGDRYDYSKVNYQRYHDKVEIGCHEHGSFFQTAGAHISQKQGCPTCSYKNYEGGYGIKRFVNFPELKTKRGVLYLIECTSANERFIKVGITQFDVEKRFSGQLPYAMKSIATIHGEMWDLFQLEQQVKRTFKQSKYKPASKFSGHTECFNADIQDAVQTFITEKSIFK